VSGGAPSASNKRVKRLLVALTIALVILAASVALGRLKHVEWVDMLVIVLVTSTVVIVGWVVTKRP
jgi:4-hydroxybenzoate polyprenyltransferase